MYSLKKLHKLALKTTFIALLFLTTLHCFSQNNHFKKGQATLQAGIGFISTLDNTNNNGLGISYPLTVPPLSLVADVGITDEISIGGYLATAKSNVYYQDLFQKIKLGTLSHFIIGVRGLYHFQLLDALDTYGGAMLGYNALKAKGYDDSEGKDAGITYTLLVGARYPFAKRAGAFIEIGYGVSAINIGLALQVK